MNRYVPFILSLMVFILVWGALIQLPYIESVSSNKAIAYCTFSLFVAIIIFVILAMLFRVENIIVNKECLKKDFTISLDEIFHCQIT